MKILILGSTGILGKTLFFYLKSKKIKFSCISRKKKKFIIPKKFQKYFKIKKNDLCGKANTFNKLFRCD